MPSYSKCGQGEDRQHLEIQNLRPHLPGQNESFNKARAIPVLVLAGMHLYREHL